MARVFISVLGTSDYQDCFYCIGNEPICQSVRFVQEALVNHVCRDWTKDDRILIFTTEKSEEKNWQDDGHIDRNSGEVIPREGLRKKLVALNVKPRLKSVRIPDGKNEEEVWRIFEILFDNLKSGDEIVFDITHAFRSIPMLVMTVLNYAKVTKRVSLSQIYYGNYEARDMDSNHAPIFDLSVFDNLLDWTFAIDSFLTSGDGTRVSELAGKSMNKVLKKTKGSDSDARLLKTIATKLNEFSQNISTCRGPNISEDVNFLRENIKLYQRSEHLKAFAPLLKLVEEKLDSFRNDPFGDGLAASRWCMDHNLIQQGFTILQESIVTFLVLALDRNTLDVTEREIASQSVNNHFSKRDPTEWRPPTRDNKERTEAYLKLISRYPGLSATFDQISGYRNDLNHAGWREDKRTASKFRLNLENLINKIESLTLANDASAI